ncbi:DUF4019 domain-containing protein [Paraherbaspirillum soli]|uniref:DUF4019 domain-containing protein n=1 Tax=Paraherbaspirillum soli TaxID=631222 RepID=A0ABW0M6U7_9BURK
MKNLHQSVRFKALLGCGMRLSAKFGKTRNLAKLFFLLSLSMLLSAGAAAQPVSADAAIDVARQWLTLADADQAGPMWEQSAALMKEQSDRTAWVSYIGSMRSQLGRAPDARVWQAMEHQIDHPNLPRGEFVSVTFVSGYAKTPAWEKVALIWLNGRWVPVGYQYGPIAAAAK